jgi:pSer/pThr/pTyr-binding forkhead associated (FHA) protein
MTRPFVAIERFFERLFERPAARLFQARLEPVQLQQRLERAMESERRLSADRTYVPNRYRVLLNEVDLDRFRSYQQTLEADLAAALHARARGRGYTLLERPRVTIESSSSVQPGDIAVRADVLDPLLLRPAQAGFRRMDPDARPIAMSPEAGATPSATATDGQQGGIAPTSIFQVPRTSAPRVVIDVRVPDRPMHRVTFEGGHLRVGRGSDNELVLADERVSRHHGQLATRQGALVYTDLGSTNGSYVNGTRITEVALGTGDVVQIGNSSLTIHAEA